MAQCVENAPKSVLSQCRAPCTRCKYSACQVQEGAGRPGSLLQSARRDAFLLSRSSSAGSALQTVGKILPPAQDRRRAQVSVPPPRQLRCKGGALYVRVHCPAAGQSPELRH
ncbi:hypothetical protein NDU88_000997 [Pleurodeles waltl]|uniref:Uncharacterized protein n=1 Tax=Pleurodeles waltl TaxID=8319 RepID=A0AAV7UTI8_PLEWA|nr:hypothetical protein NDU88_000997 [Pleurodeles waltl]